HRISKRPPLRPAIPSPYTSASSPKVIYVSSNAPFISIVKRVRKLLDRADNRSMGRISLNNRESERGLLRALGDEQERRRRNEGEEILLRATGKAIDKTMGLALFFSNQNDTTVRIGTGTVSVVDDIVEKEEQAEDPMAVDEQDEIPETQIRRTSMLEVGIRSK
ncbi:hypothetical protein MMC10_008002, partial [Thelotrema lepadinum]|nr:hypothetical protein [Thelotrema lepadinum]